MNTVYRIIQARVGSVHQWAALLVYQCRCLGLHEPYTSRYRLYLRNSAIHYSGNTMEVVHVLLPAVAQLQALTALARFPHLHPTMHNGMDAICMVAEGI